ncbi:MAG: glycosyltransferase [Chloroflexi bacterium]|nr:glycosyltransferase [Chloroflexota bacterium]
MRIGLITGEYPPMQGGVGAYSRILAGELARLGHVVHVLSSRQALNDDPAISLSPSIAGWNINSLRTIRAWARDLRLEVVNLQFQTAAYAMSPWIHFLPEALGDLPLVTTFHDLRFPYLFPKAGRLRDWIVRRLARASRGVIVTNHEDQERLRGLPHLALIPIGSNILAGLPADFDPQPWRTRAGAQPGDFLLIYFGLFNHSKGIEDLLAALAALRQNGQPTRLALVGGGAGSSDPTNTAFMDAMQARIHELSLAPFIHCTGYLDETAVGAYLAAGDVVVLPFRDGASYRRGSLMAAVHYGCAIVTTTPQVNIPSFVDGENMRLVPPGDPAALARALADLCRQPEQAAHLRRGAAALAGQFRWPSIAQSAADFFRQVVAERS